jgi:hypothetical protein
MEISSLTKKFILAYEIMFVQVRKELLKFNAGQCSRYLNYVEQHTKFKRKISFSDYLKFELRPKNSAKKQSLTGIDFFTLHFLSYSPILYIVCNKTFITSSDLSRHLSTHTGIKNYQVKLDDHANNLFID